jgi:hypothetical protein
VTAGAEATARHVILGALRDPRRSWITLPRADAEVPAELRVGLDAFDAGERPAGVAATAWLKTQAVGSHQTSRTRLLVAAGRVDGFYSLASAQVELSQRDRRRISVDPVRVPAALVTWIAKDIEATIDGRELLLHALATARRVGALQATAVLVVDAFDDGTAAMWRDRFDFRPSAEERGGRRRLWLPLETEG